MKTLPEKIKARARELHKEHKTVPLALIESILCQGADLAVEGFVVEIKSIRKEMGK